MWLPKLLLLIPILVFLIYLNQVYANFFNRIGEYHLPNPYLNADALIKLGNTDAPPLTYVALGDSLTSGVGSDNYKFTYPYLFTENLSRKYTVTLVNKSQPGAKITDLDPFISDTKKLRPNLITIFIGINDLFNQTPLNTFEDKYNQMLTELDDGKTKIILITIPYLGTKSATPFPYNFLYELQLKKYNKVIDKVAGMHSNNIKVFDLYNAAKSEFANDESNYSVDQFHPSAKGYILWAELLSNSKF